MNKNIIISVIVPTCNRKDLLGKCLDQLAPHKQTLQFELYEVIVTDDSSGEDSFQLIKDRYDLVSYTKGPRKGPGANRNHGAKIAKGEWLVFTDDDCIPNSNYLEEYFKIIAKGLPYQALEGAVHPERPYDNKTEECPVNLSGNCFWSANVAIQKRLFEKINGFDEAYKIAAQEDQDIYLRIQQLTDVLFVSSSIVIHPIRKINMVQKFATIKTSSTNWVYFAWKNKDILKYHNRIGIIKAGYKSQLTHFIKSLLHFRFRPAFYSFSMLVYGMPYIIYKLYLNNESEEKQ